MAWKKVLLEGDAATLSDTTSDSVGTTPSAGTGEAAARFDHIHDIGAGAIDNSNLFAGGVVDETAIGTNAVTRDKMADDSVGGAEISNTATDIELSQVKLTPKATGESGEGAIFYDSDDDHLYIYTS